MMSCGRLGRKLYCEHDLETSSFGRDSYKCVVAAQIFTSHLCDRLPKAK